MYLDAAHELSPVASEVPDYALSADNEAFDELLADRVRTCLQQVAGVSEKKMFGGLAFMTGGHLTVGVYGDGLIARSG